MASGGIGNQSPATLFQARLDTMDSVSNTLTLGQYIGNKVVVSGLTVVIPSSGLMRDIADNLIDASGADAGAPPAASTLYFVYVSNQQASFSPSSIRLSATSPVLLNGVRYLGTSGNAVNWRFVGWVVTNATPQFESTVTSRLIANYYNRLKLKMYVNPGYVDDNAATTYTVNSASWQPLSTYVGSGTSRLSFISNGEDSIIYQATMVLSSANPSNSLLAGVGLDSVSEADQAALSVAGVQNDTIPVQNEIAPVEGSHFLEFLAAFTGGNVLFYADLGRLAGGTIDYPATALSAEVIG